MLGFFIVFSICFAGIVLLLVGFNIQFQEVSLFVRFLFYIPAPALLVVWFFSAFKFMKSTKKIKKTPKFADPKGDASSSNKTDFQNKSKDYSKLHTLTGSFVALAICLFFFWSSYFGCHGDAFENMDRNSMRKLVTPELETIADRVEKYYQQNNSYTKAPDKLNSDELSSWLNIFTCGIDCFEPERIALEEDKSLSYTIEFYDKHKKDYAIHSDVYEFWLDENDPSHFKLRYNTANETKQINYPLDIIIYYADISKFKEASSTRLDRNYPLSRTYMHAQEWDFSESLGCYVYDSKTKEFSFVYDSFWGNFYENYKVIFFTIVYLLTIISGYLLVKLVKHLAIIADKPKYMKIGDHKIEIHLYILLCMCIIKYLLA